MIPWNCVGLWLVLGAESEAAAEQGQQKHLSFAGAEFTLCASMELDFDNFLILTSSLPVAAAEYQRQGHPVAAQCSHWFVTQGLANQLHSPVFCSLLPAVLPHRGTALQLCLTAGEQSLPAPN